MKLIPRFTIGDYVPLSEVRAGELFYDDVDGSLVRVLADPVQSAHGWTVSCHDELADRDVTLGCLLKPAKTDGPKLYRAAWRSNGRS